jgi:hypothetical protein
MNNWGFVLAAYTIAAVVLLGYWWRVERRIRTFDALGDALGDSLGESPGQARK